MKYKVAAVFRMVGDKFHFHKEKDCWAIYKDHFLHFGGRQAKLLYSGSYWKGGELRWRRGDGEEKKKHIIVLKNELGKIDKSWQTIDRLQNTCHYFFLPGRSIKTVCDIDEVNLWKYVNENKWILPVQNVKANSSTKVKIDFALSWVKLKRKVPEGK